MSMAAKLSDIGNEMSKVNSQVEAPMDVPSQSALDLWELEASGSSPSCLLSWSQARRLPSSCPNMKHCLEICVTLTEELGSVPPTLSFLDDTPSGGCAMRCNEQPHQNGGHRPR